MAPTSPPARACATTSESAGRTFCHANTSGFLLFRQSTNCAPRA